MCFMKTRELLLLLALTATTGMQAQRIKGSDTVLPIAQQTAERFMILNPSARVTVTGGGTGVGISALLDQTTDIAMASTRHQVQRKDESQSCRRRLGRSTHRLRRPCRSGSPLQPGETTDPPTTGRYLPGKITNWQQVGGDDRKIVVYSRETSSGTYEFFKESVLKTRTT